MRSRLPAVLVLVQIAATGCGYVNANTAAQVISARSGAVLSGARITNPHGPCVEIRDGSNDIRVEEVEIGPCGGDGIIVRASANVVIRRVHIHNTAGNGVTIEGSTGVVVADSRVNKVSTGVYALDSRQIEVSRNRFRNVVGPMPRGQFVQFDKVTGPGNRILCNFGVNAPGESAPEDAINLYKSAGDREDPIEVAGNRIEGGGPSLSGGGILLGDGGGAHQIARDNVLVDAGQYGLGVAGGHHMELRDNTVFGRSQPFTNVGIYVWNQYGEPCYAVAVEHNRVNWRNREGEENPRWSEGNCGPIAGWNANDWNARIDPRIEAQRRTCPDSPSRPRRGR